MMLKDGKKYVGKGLIWGGCSCHNSKRLHRKAKKAAKARERRDWQRDQEGGK